MRTYIFIERERKIIQSFVDGKIPLTNRELTKIRTTIREPKLFVDVKLLFTLRDQVEASMAEMPPRKRGLE